MNIEDHINEHGFLFSEMIPDRDLYLDVMLMDAPDAELENGILKMIQSFDPKAESVKCVFEDISTGEMIELHTHLIPARYQVLIWFPPHEYVGRDFVYGTKDGVKEFHPQYGDVCFLKTNDIKFLHGVTKLETPGVKMRTIVVSVDSKAKRGEQLTVSAKGLSVLP